MGNCNNCIDEKSDKDVKIDQFGPGKQITVKSRASQQRENPDSSSPTFDLPAPHQEEIDVQFQETRKPVQAGPPIQEGQYEERGKPVWAVHSDPEPNPASKPTERPVESKPDMRPAPEPEPVVSRQPVASGLADVQTIQNTFRILFAKKAVREVEGNQRDLPDPADKRPEASTSSGIQDLIGLLTRECRATLESLPKYKFTFAVRGVASYPPRALGDGSIYVGQWASVGSGLYRKGKGRLYKQDGSYQEGYWVGPRLHAHGRMIASNGDYYEGELKDGLRNGEGVFKSFDQRTEYRGSWANDLKYGRGTERKPDNSQYVGDFERNERTGKGKIILADGKEYEGGFLNGQYSGYGVHTWKDGRRYEGGWLNGKMHNFGKFVYPDGKTYEGQYADDKKNGKGVYKWEGKIYDGDWVDGKMHGIGLLTTDKGTKKYEFRNGERIKEVRE